jgi:hypothetical protein
MSLPFSKLRIFGKQVLNHLKDEEGPNSLNNLKNIHFCLIKMEDPIKKRRGRKPKNFENGINEPQEELKPETIVEKKKRGRKKKYEIENFDKLNNRELINNFNHHIAHSDDESIELDNTQNIKKVSFGNLNITISKKENVEVENYKNYIKPVSQIDENEWESDQESQENLELQELSESEQEDEIIEKVYKENKKYSI